MGPIFKLTHISHGLYILIAILTGIAFGAILTVSGFISTKKLTGVFYFDDFAVLKVLFTGIVVGSIGIYLLGDLGTLNFSRIYIPRTFWISQFVGGLLFGVGFILSGYCPGTSIISAVTGSLDAIIVIVGMLAGMAVFGIGFPLWEKLYLAGEAGKITLPDVFGVNHWVVIGALVVIAVFMYIHVELFEKR